MRQPSRGVTWTVSEVELGMRLDKFLAAADRLSSRTRARDAIARGRIFVNDREAGPTDAGLVLALGDRVRLWEDRPGSARAVPRPDRSRGLSVIYEDAALVVVNKPAGLLVVPVASRPEAATVEALLVRHLRSRGKVRPLIVHRIDRDTSGLVVFAKSGRAQQALKAQFEQRTASRVYLAVVRGRPGPAAGVWRDRLVWSRDALIQRPAVGRDGRAKEAVSHYRVLQTFEGATLLEVTLESGRQNQIRVQALLHGHPLLGERKYTDNAGEAGVAPTLRRQALHAWRLGFDHPLTGRRLDLEAPLPADLEALIRRLGRATRHLSRARASLVRPGRRVRTDPGS